ncbi:MAG TPA: 50S ribosomal protein L3 [bacterium]|nr:50S ribosomal protein L3 [bacterium]
MALGIIGKKIGMTQVFDARGHLIPVTVIQAGPCPIIQKKTVENDGYAAIQVGFGEAGKKQQKNKPMQGHFKASGINQARILREFKVEDIDSFELGQELKVDMFKPAESVSISGLSKGRGFTGVMKRHGFSGKNASHGVHEGYRHGGSIGCRVPKRTIKGMRMAGRMGNERFTIRNIQIVMVDRHNHLLMVKGAVPGWKGGFVIVRKAK